MTQCPRNPGAKVGHPEGSGIAGRIVGGTPVPGRGRGVAACVISRTESTTQTESKDLFMVKLDVFFCFYKEKKKTTLCWRKVGCLFGCFSLEFIANVCETTWNIMIDVMGTEIYLEPKNKRNRRQNT